MGLAEWSCMASIQAWQVFMCCKHHHETSFPALCCWDPAFMTPTPLMLWASLVRVHTGRRGNVHTTMSFPRHI